jgi:hypothetical protein
VLNLQKKLHIFCCLGQFKAPSNGTRLIFFPGTTVKIDWSYVGDISQVQLRTWFFNSRGGSRIGQLTLILFDRVNEPLNTSLIRSFDIERPAALVLKNVDQTYNGMYTFNLQTKLPNSKTYLSEVDVFIASKF